MENMVVSLRCMPWSVVCVHSHFVSSMSTMINMKSLKQVCDLMLLVVDVASSIKITGIAASLPFWWLVVTLMR